MVGRRKYLEGINIVKYMQIISTYIVIDIVAF